MLSVCAYRCVRVCTDVCVCVHTGVCVRAYRCVCTSVAPCCLVSSDRNSDSTVGSDCFTLGSSRTSSPRLSGLPSALGTCGITT